MPRHENTPKVETAIDLTDPERNRLYNAMEAALAKRGKLVPLNPEALKALDYVDPDKTLPRQSFTFAVPSEELLASGIPYDKLSLGQRYDHPHILSFGAGRTVMRSVLLPSGGERSVMGEDVQGVTLSREPHLGVVVEYEGSTGLYYDATDSKTTIDDGRITGQPLELHGTNMQFLDGEAMTRPELLTLTEHIERLT